MMIGVVLMSHGNMAKGMLHTLTMFFGKEIPQLAVVVLDEQDDPQLLDERIKAAIDEVDDGHGVVGFCDLTGGTPFNRCARMISDQFHVISGINLAMVMELLSIRDQKQIAEIDMQALVEAGRNGMLYLNERLRKKG